MLLVLTSGCSSAALQDPKTYDDLGTAACEILAVKKAEEAKAQGISLGDIAEVVKKVCAEKERAQPFIDALLAAEQEEDSVMGAHMGIEGD